MLQRHTFHQQLECGAASQLTLSPLQISYKAVASLPRLKVPWAVLMCLYRISTECNGPLEAAHAHILY